MDYKTGKYVSKKIVVADTVGLCDTDWTDEQTFKLITGRVSSNLKYIDAVFMVFKADRLLKEHIKPMKEVMDWLGYNKEENRMKFMFVATHAENLDDKETQRMKGEAIKMLDLKVMKLADLVDETGKYVHPLETLVYAGFPKEAYLNESGKQKIKESWDHVQLLLGIHPGEKVEIIKETRKYFGFRIDVPSMKSCVIL